MWADVPLLPNLMAFDLVKLLQNEQAVEDLRRSVRASLVTARTPGDKADRLTDLAHDFEASSHRLGRAVETDRTWQGVATSGLGLASLVIGALNGGLGPIAGGTAGLLAGLAPYLGTRITTRHTEEREIRSASAASTTVRSRLAMGRLASGESCPAMCTSKGVCHAITSGLVVFHHCNSAL
jgi:hypothetical protein